MDGGEEDPADGGEPAEGQGTDAGGVEGTVETSTMPAEDTAPFIDHSEEEEEDAEDGEGESDPSSVSINIADINLDYTDMDMEFQGVLDDLAADPNLEKFRDEYGKLHQALQRSHANERCLMDKYRELQAEIAAHSSERATALKLAAEDKNTIDALKKEVEKAWKMVDLSHEREQESKETMESLQAEISRMHELAGQGEQMTSVQQEQMDELRDTRTEMTRERNELLNEVSRLRSQLDGVVGQQEATDKQKQDVENRLQNMTQEMQVYRSDLQRESRRKDRAERDLKAAKAEIEAKQAELKSFQEKLDEGQELLEKSNSLLKEQKTMNEEAVKEAERTSENYTRLQEDYEAALLNMDQLAQENRQRASELKEREKEREELTQELLRLSKLRETLSRRLRTAEDTSADLEEQRETIESTVTRLERELENVRRSAEADQKTIDSLKHDRELLKKGILKAQGISTKQERSLKLHEQAKMHLEREAKTLRHAILKQKFVIAGLQRDRDKFIVDSNIFIERNCALLNEVKMKEIEIFDNKKRVSEAESRLKQQQNLYEAVRSDRNLYSKNLIESQTEVAELKRKFKIVVHQIDQLKEETTSREELLYKQQYELRLVQKEKEALILDLEEMRQGALRMKSRIASMEMEQAKLSKVLTDGENERNKQRKDLNQVMTERDILGTQLVRRNDELALLYEKIRIMQSTLSKGEQQYRDRINDIRLLKLEIRKLRREKSLLNRSVHNLEDMRREMYHMHRALLKERSKCKALENELQNPQNVHRWRRLEGTDPSTYEMVLKIQTLQRRLIARTQDATKKELDIQEKERLYLELKKMMARQPGPEVAEQLLLCQATIRQKTRQMKSLVSELNLYESQIQEYKQDVDSLTQQLKVIKKLYQDQKRQAQRRQKSRMKVSTNTLQPLTRFPAINSAPSSSRQPPLGGGFKLPSVPAKT